MYLERYHSETGSRIARITGEDFDIFRRFLVQLLGHMGVKGAWTVMQQPKLETERLVLRPFTLDDAPHVQRLAGDRDIASTTGDIPYPYEDGVAEDWIRSHRERFRSGEAVNYAIVIRGNNTLIGAIGLLINQRHETAEMGYWIGKPYWSNGYCTEAARVLLEYGFRDLGLNRLYANYFIRNPASGRVLEKIGMSYEGCLRQHMKKWGAFEDVNVYSILRSEYKGIKAD